MMILGKLNRYLVRLVVIYFLWSDWAGRSIDPILRRNSFQLVIRLLVNRLSLWLSRGSSRRMLNRLVSRLPKLCYWFGSQALSHELILLTYVDILWCDQICLVFLQFQLFKLGLWRRVWQTFGVVLC